MLVSLILLDLLDFFGKKWLPILQEEFLWILNILLVYNEYLVEQ